MKNKKNKYIKCFIGILFIICFFIVQIPALATYAAEQDFEKVTWSLNSNVVDDSSINIYVYEDVQYISIDELCSLTRCTKSNDGDIILVTQGFWSTKFDVANQTFDDGYQSVGITFLKISENNYAVPALMFLSYFKSVVLMEDDTLYCRMPECTAWEALDVDYENSLIDIYELYGGKGNITFSLILDIFMDFFMGDMSSSDDYVSDALMSALMVELYDYSAIKQYKEESQAELYLDIHSEKCAEFFEVIEDTLSIAEEPVEWLIKCHYNAREKSFVREAYNAYELGLHKEVTNYGAKFYDAFSKENKTIEAAERYFKDLDYIMLFVAAAVETAQDMKYINATNNLVYNVMGQENLEYLGISAKDNAWFTVANQYKNVLCVADTQFESEAIKFVTDKLYWESLIGTGVSSAAGISSGTWMFSLNIARLFAKTFPLTSSSIESLISDRRAIYLSELQQNVYWVLKNTFQNMQNKWDNPEIYSKYIQTEQLYCRTSIAMYENLITMINELGSNRDYWTSLFQKRIDMLAISLYQLTMLLDDGINNCLPLDISTFKYNKENSSNNVVGINGTELFKQLPQCFDFSSGAGGWRTRFDLNSDGTFSGNYYDSDLGDTGEGYSKGTARICNFNGKFTEPKQIDEYTYSMNLEYINTEGTPGEEYYENNERFIYADPYGFNDAKEFLIYLPGCPLNKVTDEFLSWSSINTKIRDTIPVDYYGIYNVGGKKGFVGLADNNIWEKRYILNYGNRKSELQPSYSIMTHLAFWPEAGASSLDLCFNWAYDDQTEFTASDSRGTGDYDISLKFSEDKNSVTISVTSQTGYNLAPWGGTSTGTLSAEYNLKEDN